MIKDGREFDFIFISYDEPHAEEHFELLKETVPYAKRVHGVEGEANAWKEAGRISETSHFFTMDADQTLRPDFSFEVHDWQENDERLHVWRGLNPVNGLVYGHGSIHLFNKQGVAENDNTDVLDFTLASANKGFFIQEEQASTTHFNKDYYQAWRSGFKEACKLASSTSFYPGTGQEMDVTQARLFVWCSLGSDAENGYWTMLGARMGAVYGFENKDSDAKLMDQKSYQFFEKYWFNNGVDECKLHTLLFENELKLKEKYNFHCWTFLPEHSAIMKSMLYSINRDVVNRLLVLAGKDKNWVNY